MNKRNLPLVALVVPMVTIMFVDGKLMPILPESPDLGTITAKIIKSCYEERFNVIGLAGNISDSFIASISSGDPLSTVLLNSDKQPVDSGEISKWSRYKLQVFAVMVTSSIELQQALADIKHSRWWNHMGQFYIIDSSDGEIGCSGAFEFLWRAWMMNILGAKFVCNDNAEGPLIYAFNPYTRSAPNPWRFTETHKGVNDHPWALFVRKYNDNGNICENIDFDQTKNAGGYEVRYAMPQSEVLPHDRKTSLVQRDIVQEKYLQIISFSMNISLKTLFYSEGDSVGFVDKDHNGHGMFADLTNGRADIISLNLLRQSLSELPATYPILYIQFFASTQNTPYISQWEKIISAFDRFSRIGLCIVILVTVVSLKYFLEQSFMIAILNTIRMICNSCFTKLPNNLGPRIYLACLFVFVIVMQAIFQGQLSALLTKQIRYPNVNNKQDLINSDYVIYGPCNFSSAFNEAALEGRYVDIDVHSQNCTDYLLLNSSIACVDINFKLFRSAINFKLHVSKYPVSEFALSKPVREDWPLEERFNRQNFHYVETGIAHFLDNSITTADIRRTLRSIENKENDDSPKVITLQDLDFAFVILGVGLGCAMISFLVELYIGRRRSSRVKDRALMRRKIRP